jgi:hypothetical protein
MKTNTISFGSVSPKAASKLFGLVRDAAGDDGAVRYAKAIARENVDKFIRMQAKNKNIVLDSDYVEFFYKVNGENIPMMFCKDVSACNKTESAGELLVKITKGYGQDECTIRRLLANLCVDIQCLAISAKRKPGFKFPKLTDFYMEKLRY